MGLSGSKNSGGQLYSTDVEKFDDYHERFGREKGLLIMRKPSAGSCCGPCRTCCIFLPPYYIDVPEGAYALVQKFGAEKQKEDGNPVWPSGLHCFAVPGYFVSHLVTKQAIFYNMPIKECRTLDNVSVSVDCDIMMRVMGDPKKGEDPNLVSKFVHELGPRGLEAQLIAAQQEAVRLLTRRLRHTQVYALANMTRPSGRGGGGGALLALAEEVEDPEKAVLPGGALPPVAEAEMERGGEGGGGGGGGGEGEGEGEAKGGEAAEGGEEDEKGSLTSDLDDIMDVLTGTHDKVEVRRAEKARAQAVRAVHEMIARLNRQFHPQGIEILDVIITRVQLNPEIANQMTEKTMVISRQAEQRMTQMSQMQELGFSEELTTLLQAYSEEQDGEKAQGTKEIQVVTKTLDLQRAEAAKQQAAVAEEAGVSVQMINAEARKETSKLVVGSGAVTTGLVSAAEAEAALARAECDKHVATALAEAELKVAQNKSKAAQVVNAAEEKASQMLAARRAFETHEMKIGVYDALAANEKVVIADAAGPRATQALLSEAILAGHEGRDPARARVVAEAAVMRNLADNLVPPPLGGGGGGGAGNGGGGGGGARLPPAPASGGGGFLGRG